jgi:alanine dehydrogenase
MITVSRSTVKRKSVPLRQDVVFMVDGIVHYCAANMPGAYPRTSTLALTNATLPHVKLLANKGIERAIAESTDIRSALNTYQGKITNKRLEESLGLGKG